MTTTTTEIEFLPANAGSHKNLKGVSLTRGTDTFFKGEHIMITPIWQGVDRYDVGGTSIPANRTALSLARRYASAMLTGAAFRDIEIRTDINNETYVSATPSVSARSLNADLKRLGY